MSDRRSNGPVALFHRRLRHGPPVAARSCAMFYPGVPSRCHGRVCRLVCVKAGLWHTTQLRYIVPAKANAKVARCIRELGIRPVSLCVSTQ